jgi:hypothetical protein
VLAKHEGVAGPQTGSERVRDPKRVGSRFFRAFSRAHKDPLVKMTRKGLPGHKARLVKDAVAYGAQNQGP